MKEFYFLNKGKRIFFLIGLVLPAIFFYGFLLIHTFIRKEYRIFLWGLIMLIASLFIFLYAIYGKKIIISTVGVEYKEMFGRGYKLNWQDIKEVGIGEGYRQQYRLVYFSLDKVKIPRIGPIHVDERNIGERSIKIHYRKSVIEEVKKYWIHEIME